MGPRRKRSNGGKFERIAAIRTRGLKSERVLLFGLTRTASIGVYIVEMPSHYDLLPVLPFVLKCHANAAPRRRGSTVGSA